MQSICLKSTRLFCEVARHSTRMFFAMEKHSQSSVSIIPPAPVRPKNSYLRYLMEKLMLSKENVPEQGNFNVPVNPFFRYFKEKLILLKQDVPNQDLKIRERVSKIAIEWRALPINKKQIYETQYAEDVNKFKILQEKWWNGLTEDQKQQHKSLKIEKKLKTAQRKVQKQISSLGKPKKNRSAINYFISQNMSNKDPTNKIATTGRSREDCRNLMTTLSNKWTTLSDNEKKIYNEMAEEDAIRYRRELAFWNLEIMKEGKGHLLQLGKNLEKEKRLERKKEEK